MDDHKLKPLKDPKKIITIHKGEGSSFDMLKDCFFYPTKLEGIYLLCSKHDENLAVVTEGEPFMFDHDGLIWKVPNPEPGAEQFKIDAEKASGSFWNNDPSVPAEDTGTFSAQASGGTVDDANASYAGAS